MSEPTLKQRAAQVAEQLVERLSIPGHAVAGYTQAKVTLAAGVVEPYLLATREAAIREAVNAQCLLCRSGNPVVIDDEQGFVHDTADPYGEPSWEHCEARHIHRLGLGRPNK